MLQGRCFSFVAMLFVTSALAFPAHAETLQEKLGRIVKDHDLMKVVEAEAESLQHQVSVEESRWYPTVSVGATPGWQAYRRDDGDSTKWHTEELSVQVEQTVWDFGATDQSIRKADAALHKKNVEIELQEQNLLLAGIEAHLRLRKAWEVLRYARNSEQNIRRQARMESARVDAGSGYSTDVLQAKATLSQAEARRIVAEGEVEKAVARYKAVFMDGDVDPAKLDAVRMPAALLPANLEDLLARVEKQNPDLRRAREVVAVADITKDLVEAREWAPTVKLVGEHAYDRNVDGLRDGKWDSSVKLKVAWSFDTGLKAASAVHAAAADASAERAKAFYVGRQAVEESVNAWNAMRVAREQSRMLQEQMDLQKQFLEFARKERELGRRSLLDVLNGETQLLNAEGDYAAAQIDLILSAYRVIRAYGGVRLDDI